jgi:hypothetical protein
MILTAHFFLLNDNFSPEYAEANHGGQETENNPRYEWEDELEVSEGLASVNIHRQGDYFLAGELPDGKPFNLPVPNMFLVELKMENGAAGFFAVSESILDSFEIEGAGTGHQVLKVYLKDYEPLANPMPGVFIASQEFPKELVF